MNEPIRQQIVISGLGGQGVLFVTGLLAETAIDKGLSVFTSETHGMAQRGGTVISHLKVGDFASPLIRPSHADGLIALKAENLAQHGAYVKETGWITVNSSETLHFVRCTLHSFNADRIAQEIGNPKSVNLIVLGFTLAKQKLFCTMEEIKASLQKRFAHKASFLESSLHALHSGSMA